MHSFFQLCNYTAILAGLWHGNDLLKLDHPAPVSPWKHCPKTFNAINHPGHIDLHDATNAELTRYFLSLHVEKYSCLNTTHMHQVYKTPGCHMLSINRALRVIKAKNKVDHNKETARITYVGDSLIAQHYISALCAIEERKESHHLRATYLQDMYLRGDYPCHEKCLQTPTSRRNHSEPFNICEGCLTGARVFFKDYLNSSDFWVKHIPNDTAVLVLGSGSWYNLHKGLLDSSFAYQEMLQGIAPYLNELVVDRKVKVFWLGLPPTDPTSEEKETFEWDYFRGKDEIASRILSLVGVTFVNVSALVEERVRLDKTCRSDHLHWCNPGAHSVPTFINEVVWHLTASALVHEKHSLLASIHH